MSVLDVVLQRIHRWSQPRLPVAVFDLDSTLFSTQHRNFAILAEFAARPDTPEAFRVAAAKVTVDEMGWNIMDDLHARGFEDRAVLKRLREYWFERFFKDDYLHHDEPLDGAAEYVRETHRAGALVYYLTGRDEPNMMAGTRRSLASHGFPVDLDRTILRLKPKFEDSDLEFKRMVMEELHDLGAVTAAFENEPANANLFAETFPEADVLFLETVHSPNPPPLLPRIHRLKNFRR